MAISNGRFGESGPDSGQIVRDLDPPAAPLLAWYDQNRRKLPWRRTRDPYRIWVSEIMLQQTRVETVLPYYRQFLHRFADVRALAAAPIDEVMAVWSGLGYYRRVQNMHLAARHIAAHRFPRSAEALQQLPGIGAYTAAAIASIAFGERAAVLDGNSIRVLSRLLGIRARPEKVRTRKRLLAAAQRLLARERPGDSNQALMELGATLCSPRQPRCPQCPLCAACRGARSGRPERYPAPRRRRAQRRVCLVAAVVVRYGRILLLRRSPESGLLAGTWEVPWAESRAQVGEVESALTDRYGGRWRLRSRLGDVRHSITDRRLEVEVRRAALADSGVIAEAGEAGWFTAPEIAELPLSSLAKKVLRRARF